MGFFTVKSSSDRQQSVGSDGGALWTSTETILDFDVFPTARSLKVRLLVVQSAVVGGEQFISDRLRPELHFCPLIGRRVLSLLSNGRIFP